MLNVGRMAPGSHDYYLSVVASGAEDYYLARGEEPGRWLGRGAADLRLEGQVEADQLRRVLAGADPHSGERLARHPARKVPGFDLTFRAPKSVSLLWGLSDSEVAAKVTAAHDGAVDAAVSYLERAAGWTRRGAAGAERVATKGVVAAGFRHRTSRANDPLLHTHVLVANLTQTSDDGIWRTLDSKALYGHARTAGFLYQSHLRYELSRTLGVEWGPVTNGYADLAGVPRSWVDHFSRRRAAIVRELEDRGESSAKAAQVATLDTREPKQLQASEAQLRTAWWRRAQALGVDRYWTKHLLGRSLPKPPELGELFGELVTGEALTEQTSTFSRRDVLRAVAERLPSGAPVESVEQIADAILEHDPDRVIQLRRRRGQLTALDVIRRADGTVVPAQVDETRYTTRGLLLTEQRAITRALRRRDAGVATVDPANVEAVLGRRSLSDEQATMVRQLTRSGHGVEVVVGKAGTGKTYALDAARDAWNRAGIRVTGVALAARAALELQDAAGIPSTTLARLLTQLEADQPGSPLAPRSVLVVDEAGMVGTRKLDRLLAHAERTRAKVVLVGDPHQLPEIDAGGLFRALATRLPAIQLAQNRRQTNAWEAAALDQLRDGDPTRAVAAYHEHGRIITADTAEAIREQLVADWWDTYDRLGSTSAVMVALRRADVAELNARARARLLAAGHLTGPILEVDGLAFQAGDRIISLRNDRRLGIVNGTRGNIAAVDHDHRSLVITTDDDRQITLPVSYLEAGHVAHSYAITGHKAQGLTVDATFVLGSEELYREWGYVALSRGRHSNRLYIQSGVQQNLGVAPHGPAPPDDPRTRLGAALSRSRAEQPVSDGAQEVSDLAAHWRELAAWRTSAPVLQAQQLREQQEATQRTHIEVSRALQRTEAEHDEAARGLARFRNRGERSRLAARRDQLELRLSALDDDLAATEQRLRHLPNPAEIAAKTSAWVNADRCLREIAEQRAVQHLTHPPAYLLTTIGAPPPHREGRRAWQEAASGIEAYRLRWGITDAQRPLGSAPLLGGLQQRDHDHAALVLDQTRHALHRTAGHERSLARGLTR